MEIALVFVVGAMNILCFIIGAKVGQAVSRGKDVELPSLNPVEIVVENRAKREAKQETRKKQDRIDVILQNIEGYDGTSRGQKNVPRG